MVSRCKVHGWVEHIRLNMLDTVFPQESEHTWKWTLASEHVQIYPVWDSSPGSDFVGDIFLVELPWLSAKLGTAPPVFVLWLLMEEILHHLRCIKPCKWDKLPISWCRISAINRITAFVVISRKQTGGSGQYASWQGRHFHEIMVGVSNLRIFGPYKHVCSCQFLLIITASMCVPICWKVVFSDRTRAAHFFSAGWMFMTEWQGHWMGHRT